jgi:hypothetical protein
VIARVVRDDPRDRGLEGGLLATGDPDRVIAAIGQYLDRLDR